MTNKITGQAANANEKMFLEEFELLCYSRNNWQVWTDFITATAIAIANLSEQNTKIREKREKEFEECIKGLGNHDVTSKMFGVVMMALEENPEQDFLGNIFMKLELGNHWRGQFFTPYSICELMAEMTSDDLEKKIKDKGWVSVNDCACGAGATLIAAANVFRKHNIDFQKHVLFTAQDVDRVTGMMCYIQLSLLGCPGYVVIANSLTDPMTGNSALFPVEKEGQEFWYTPMWYSDVWNMRRIWNQMDLLFASNKTGKDLTHEKN